MDKDRDGTITEDEIQHAVKTIGLKLNDTQMLELMNRMDLDGDGVFVSGLLLSYHSDDNQT